MSNQELATRLIENARQLHKNLMSKKYQVDKARWTEPREGGELTETQLQLLDALRVADELYVQAHRAEASALVADFMIEHGCNVHEAFERNIGPFAPR